MKTFQVAKRGPSQGSALPVSSPFSTSRDKDVPLPVPSPFSTSRDKEVTAAACSWTRGSGTSPELVKTPADPSRTSRRWSDFAEEEYHHVDDDEEVKNICKIYGLPHLSVHPNKEPAKDAWPEEIEPKDELTEHGLKIGRSRHGRGGLSVRLRTGT